MSIPRSHSDTADTPNAEEAMTGPFRGAITVGTIELIATIVTFTTPRNREFCDRVMKLLLFVCVLSAFVIGCSNSTPTAPTPAPAPPIPTAQLVSVRAELRVFDCSRTTCAFTGEAVNMGPGCAVNVRGVTRFSVADAERHQVEWALPPTQRINPQEVFAYGGNFPLTVFAGRDGTYITTYDWDNTPC